MPERVRQLMDGIAEAVESADYGHAIAVVKAVRPLLLRHPLVATFDAQAQRTGCPILVVTTHGWIVAVTAREIWARPVEDGVPLAAVCRSGEGAVLRRTLAGATHPAGAPPG